IQDKKVLQHHHLLFYTPPVLDSHHCRGTQQSPHRFVSLTYSYLQSSIFFSSFNLLFSRNQSI
ncbi:hypothetical protein S245_048032, partial [Arachis hypogaea]